MKERGTHCIECQYQATTKGSLYQHKQVIHNGQNCIYRNMTFRLCYPIKTLVNKNNNSLCDKCSSVSKTELHKGVHTASKHELMLKTMATLWNS